MVMPNLTAAKLTTIRIDKPWGRHMLWPSFANAPADGEPIGEIWYKTEEATPTPELLVKYLFTSERLSIQVHPDDVAARAAGHPCGKDEAWMILAAEPGATIALGPRERVSLETLRAAALDGSIEALMDWRPVNAGDVIYSAAGTVHAIGAGITLIEVQQNIDLTYRLYDYGRPRALHLDQGIAVSSPLPFIAPPAPPSAEPGRTILCEGGKFVVERLTTCTTCTTRTLPKPSWLIPVTGGGAINGVRFTAGECWMADGDAKLNIDGGSELLLAYSGAVRAAL
jgi:mannose-6-phosphate isomerase